MNRVFKTAWSSIRQQYVVTDEHHAAKGKATKSAVAIAVAALLTVSGAASAAYVQGSHALDGVNWAKDAECIGAPETRGNRTNLTSSHRPRGWGKGQISLDLSPKSFG